MQALSRQQRDEWEKINRQRDSYANAIAGLLCDGHEITPGLLDNYRRLTAAWEAYYAQAYPTSATAKRLQGVS
jgi:hypothetical protein